MIKTKVISNNKGIKVSHWNLVKGTITKMTQKISRDDILKITDEFYSELYK